MAKENIRIAISDLVAAVRILGEVKVVVAGSMWATLRCSEKQRKELANRVTWVLD